MADFLIADDEPQLQILYKDILEMLGHKIVGTAYNGIEAIELLDDLEKKPDFILMDHRMPGMDGLTATKNILEKYPDIKIIFISADTTVESAALNTGAVAFVAKPFTVTDLLGVINKHL